MHELKHCKKLLIEINQTCNLNCTYCFYRDYGKSINVLSLDNIKEMLIKCPNVEEFYLTGGECFTCKDIEKIIDLLSKKGKVYVFTNGVILNSYQESRLKDVVSKVDRFFITFDSFDFNNYICRKKLDMTLETIKKILFINREKIEVKVCVSHYNVRELDDIFQKLVDLGVKYLSVNLIFDIKKSNIKHEVKDIQELKKIFEVIDKFKKYFNNKYIDMLKELYISGKENLEYPCRADKDYFYLDCFNNYLICPGNCKSLGERGNWKQCYTRECANEWEIMYSRGE